MLPDGSYRMSQTQAAESVGLTERNAREFLQSKALKSLMGEGYTPQISEIEPDESQGRGGSRINAVPIEVVSKYWLWQVLRGNKKALALVDALTTETIERRFDAAFGVSRTEQERNDRLTARVQQLERELESIGDALELDNAQSLELRSYREDNQRLRQLLDENGVSER